MRYLVVLVVLGGLARQARADGFYVIESVGATEYRGGLSAYGSTALRLELGVGYRRGSPARDHWAYEFVGGGLINGSAELSCERYDDCDLGHDGEYNFVGVNIKRRWPVAQSRWTGLGARFAVHAGPRMYWGLGALTGYDGAGFNAGAAIEGDIWVFGYSLGVGMDAMWMTMPVDSVVGTAPYVMLGVRFGWL